MDINNTKVKERFIRVSKVFDQKSIAAAEALIRERSRYCITWWNPVK